MANIKKLREAFEMLLNEEDNASAELMHEYFVGLARKVNEDLQDAELDEAELDFGNEVEDDMDEIDAEEGVTDFDDDGGFDADEEMDFDGEEGSEMDFDADEAPEDELQDLADAFDDLKAQFDAIVGDDMGDDMGGDFPDDGAMDMDDDMDGDFADDIGSDFGDEDDDGFDLDLGESVDDDEDLDEAKDDDDCDDDDSEDLDEAVDLEKVSAPSNTEGNEVGTGGSFAVNKTQNIKGQGPLKSGTAKAITTTGGEAKGYKPLNQQGGAKAKDMNGVSDNKIKGKVKSSQKKVTHKPKEGGDVGNGKTRGVEKKTLINKKVR